MIETFDDWSKDILNNITRRVPPALFSALVKEKNKDYNVASFWSWKNGDILLKEASDVMQGLEEKTQSGTETVIHETDKEKEESKTPIKNPTIQLPPQTNDLFEKGLCNVCKKPGNNVCSKCQKVRYCSRDCQKTDWKTHKTECKSQKDVVFRSQFVSEILPLISGEISILYTCWKRNYQKSARTENATADADGAIIVECLDWTVFHGEGKLGEGNVMIGFYSYLDDNRPELRDIILKEKSQQKQQQNTHTLHVVCCDTSGFVQSVFLPSLCPFDTVFSESIESVLSVSRVCVFDLVKGFSLFLWKHES